MKNTLTKPEFKDIFDLYFDPIRNYIYYRCADEDVASDIAQDVFMRVWEKRDVFDTKNIKALLYKIANDMVISDYRKSATRLDYAKDMVGTGIEPLSPQEMLQFEELKAVYSSALSEMGELQREAFLMSRNEELKYHEISDRLGISVKAVEKRITGALQFLKTKLL
ncbi:RNA polymerase sigma-70 factor (family 1) [Parabacteroides sp. PFB2-12]|uniref:RNA polymerase sigma factor n=1 Tax=unclassified Parabacteroides TaxID=2649774 RepID=UPI0024766EAD|nr:MULTISPECIES: sigma-70 family RNA polymerase sigma factor [unclassified Parabacteroides]MDH6341890.1 RNA polymerase sigma-70 factor (family 1) [Parabacteroides sp. PM6-13]MDH6389588.1 RNA polymerase sigma-70 factor (family 1) [Parabacteroides sp. PFB2-12]